MSAGDFEVLLRRSGVEGDLGVGQGNCGLGLIVSKEASKGEVKATFKGMQECFAVSAPCFTM